MSININLPLSPLASAYKEEIERADGISDLDPYRTASQWEGISTQAPFLFPADECWERRPQSSDVFLSDILHGFNKKKTKVYQRGVPYQPCEDAPIHKVLKQLWTLDPAYTFYAINMEAESAVMRIPDRFQGRYSFFSDNVRTTTNITPRYSAAELYIGILGKAVITSLHGDCIKIWALYPLTEHNIHELAEERGSTSLFVNLQGMLEGGEFCLQTPSEAIYLPPGCIHATVTLWGGFATGFEFTTVECMRPSATSWDLKVGEMSIGKGDCIPFLEAILMGLDSDLPSKNE
ncbi:hypothetical protein GGR56DRAFT_681213 [Xylariaceae sp. FL0804]|nr:hypothetical protein GGR56DRAFT_681213 [Xylariaceae sp. FL0804]